MEVLKVLPLLLMLGSVMSQDPDVGLRFGDDLTSYIMEAPDMSPLQEQVSICAWVKKITPVRTSSGYIMKRGWVDYRTSDYDAEILISDNLYYAYMLNNNISHSTAPVHAEWYHMCLTFSYSTRTKSLYYNGEKIGTETTPSGRKLSLATGTLVIGQFQMDYKMEEYFNINHPFGGELAKFNVFARTLTDQEVADMYSSGICSNYEHSLTEDTFLSWDTLLGDETEKHGNIVKFNLTCPAHTHSVEPTTAQPTEQPEDSCQDRWGFLRSSDFENQV